MNELGLKEKLDLFKELSEEEREKVIDKFMPTLALVSYEELERALNYLRTQNVFITHAREIKVMAEENFAKKFDIMHEVNATDLYSMEPVYLIRDALDLFKKIKYCLQTGHSYRNPDGTYKSFLFDEGEWGKEFSEPKEEVVEAKVEPVSVPLEEPEDIKRYDEVVNEANKDIDTLEAKINSFEEIKNNIESQTREELNTRDAMQDELGLNELDNLNVDFSTPIEGSYNPEAQNSYTPLNSDDNGLDDMFSFADIPVDEYDLDNGRGGR